jgi:hypothetical protein
LVLDPRRPSVHDDAAVRESVLDGCPQHRDRFDFGLGFSVIVVFAQELVPGKVGMVSGLCFGFAFGVAGVGAALLGWIADLTSINFVFGLCSYFPAVGLLAAFLPNIEPLGFEKYLSRQRPSRIKSAALTLVPRDSTAGDRTPAAKVAFRGEDARIARRWLWNHGGSLFNGQYRACTRLLRQGHRFQPGGP